MGEIGLDLALLVGRQEDESPGDAARVLAHDDRLGVELDVELLLAHMDPELAALLDDQAAVIGPGEKAERAPVLERIALAVEEHRAFGRRIDAGRLATIGARGLGTEEA